MPLDKMSMHQRNLRLQSSPVNYRNYMFTPMCVLSGKVQTFHLAKAVTEIGEQKEAPLQMLCMD